MQIKAALFSVLAATAAVVSAAPQIVWTPTITSPVTGTIWQVGHSANVTWDASNPPAGASANFGTVVLNSQRLDFHRTIASDFLLIDGSVEITVPLDVTPFFDYTVTLFGDSGDVSPPFVITG